jgi:thiol-disulfide isomerase/thioredoxin
MSPRISIVAGLVTGIAAATLVLGGILALAPEPVPAATPGPSAPVGSGAPGSSPSGSPAGPGGSATTSASPPSGSPGASAGASGSPAASGDAALFHVGERAPALVVPQVGGGTIDLTNLRGQPVWVNFMGTYCPPCVDEFPLMNGFAARYADEGLVVLAIDVREDEGTVAAFAERLGTTFPLGLDADGSAVARWDAVALPVHFWIDKDGVIRDGALGGIGPDVMAQGVSTIMPGVDVTP